MIPYSIDSIVKYFLNVTIADKSAYIPFYNDASHQLTDEELSDYLISYFPQITIFSDPDEITIYRNDDRNANCLSAFVRIPYRAEYSKIHKDFKPVDPSEWGWLDGNVITDKVVIIKVLEYFSK